MTTQIKCPHCKELFEPTDAYKHEQQEKLIGELEKKHLQELEATKEKIYSQATKELDQKTKIDLKDKQDQIAKLKTRAEQAEAGELKIRKEKRELEEAKRKFEIEKQRQLDKERDSIRDKALKEAQEGHELKDKERDMVIQSLEKSLADAQRKVQQGSQQTQGEVLELEIEEILKKEFPQDIIEEVKKGARGADIVQKVVDKKGQMAGTILWESKNGKWQPAWIKKLKEDQRQAKADISILATKNLPADIKDFAYRESVWIVSRKMIIPIAFALRFNLVKVNHERGINTNKNEKMAVLYQYMTSIEFKHRIEAIVEAFTELQEQTEKEKRFFNIKWANQEKSLRKVIDHTHGMYGELQSMVGKSLPEIKSLQLEEGEA
jgi:hypothetical protein